jgi:HK97 family phage prohead protease
LRDPQNKDSVARFIAAPVELRFAPGGTEDGIVEGYGSVFGVQDQHGDMVQAGAFAASLARHKAAGTMPAMLWQHDPSEPIGVWERAEEDGRGLKLSGHINLNTVRGREAHALLKQGALNGLSIGFVTEEGGAEVDRRTGLRKLTALDLWEVSIVTFPSNRSARVTGVKSQPVHVESREHLETLLRDAGLAKAAARAVTARGWAGLVKPDASAAELLAEIRNFNSNLKEI